MNILLAIATVLGGFAALCYFWDKLRGRRQEPNGPPPTPHPDQKWVDINYPTTSGLQKQLKIEGFRVNWCPDYLVARRTELEGWEKVHQTQPGDGVATLHLRDSPFTQTLLKRRE
jgi:hypothetical protein